MMKNRQKSSKIMKKTKNHEQIIKNQKNQKKKRLRPGCLPQKFYILTENLIKYI